MFKNVLKATVSAVMLLAMAANHGHAEILQIPLTKVGDNYGLMTTINGQAVPMVLDTGAESICLPSATAYQLIQAGRMTPSEIGGNASMSGASGEITRVGTVMLREVRLNDISGHWWRISNVPAIVGCDEPLLGQKFLRSVQSYSIDNASNMLVLTTPPAGSAMPEYMAEATPPAPTYTPALPEVPHYSLPSYGNFTAPTETPATVPEAPAVAPISAAYKTGLADGQAYRAWAESLKGDYRAGNDYWASVRSVPSKAKLGCNALGVTAEFVARLSRSRQPPCGV